LKLCARKSKWYSDTVSAIVVPSEYDAQRVIDYAYTRYNLSLGAGLSQLAGKVFRIGHLGDHNEISILAVIAGTEMALRDAGLKVTPGCGPAAAEEYFRKQFRSGSKKKAARKKMARSPI
jgi:alanine-glyoxylate transaminase/serine-glyoxylate transaminase/serine-pyruvate transaminase